MTAAVSIKELKFAFAGRGAFSIGPVTVEVPKGCVAGIVGPSGCGKTTFLRLVANLLPNDSAQQLTGVLSYPGLDTTRRHYKTLLFQSPFLLPNLTVLENATAPFRGEASNRSEEAKSLLSRMGIGEKLHTLPEELSGGMKSRLALIRALLLRPQLLLMDEPFIGLDVRFREDAYQLIEKFVEVEGTTVLLVSHDLEEIWRMCTTVFVFSEDGSAITMFNDFRHEKFLDFRSSIIDAFSNRKSDA